MSRGKPMKDIHRALDEALGIQVNLKTLRKFVLDHMEEEYETYMSASPRKRGKTASAGAGKPGEKDNPAPAGVGNRKEEVPKQTPNEPAATGTSDPLSDLLGQAVQPRKFDV